MAFRRSGFDGFYVERAIGFENAAAHLAQMFEALAMNDFNELFVGERFAPDRLMVDASRG